MTSSRLPYMFFEWDTAYICSDHYDFAIDFHDLVKRCGPPNIIEVRSPEGDTLFSYTRSGTEGA